MVINTHAVFSFIGIILGSYVLYAVYAGGIWSTTWFNRPVYWERKTSPVSYWSSVVIYGLLSIALVTIF